MFRSLGRLAAGLAIISAGVMLVSVTVLWAQGLATGTLLDESSLVTTRQIKLNLAGAEQVLEGARHKAEGMELKVNIAVVDEGGHLLAFLRMDGARPASVYTALTKATTAATLRAPTRPVPGADQQPNVLLNLSLQNAAESGGGKITTLLGGVPIVVREQVIGAVGVGGATGEQDAEIAQAGISAFLAALGEPTP